MFHLSMFDLSRIFYILVPRYSILGSLHTIMSFHPRRYSGISEVFITLQNVFLQIFCRVSVFRIFLVLFKFSDSSLYIFISSLLIICFFFLLSSSRWLKIFWNRKCWQFCPGCTWPPSHKKLTPFHHFHFHPTLGPTPNLILEPGQILNEDIWLEDSSFMNTIQELWSSKKQRLKTKLNFFLLEEENPHQYLLHYFHHDHFHIISRWWWW